MHTLNAELDRTSGFPSPTGPSALIPHPSFAVKDFSVERSEAAAPEDFGVNV